MKFLFALVVVALGCSIDKKSDGFTECQRQTDCAPGQSCANGVCQVITDSGPHDMPPSCPSQCNSCRNTPEGRECVINCMITPAICNAPIVCPEGFDCDITCSTQSSCQKGITCSGDQDCKIACTGQGSCREISCGDGRCDVSCPAQNSCRDIQCNNSCACDVKCGLQANCEAVRCTAGCDINLGEGCSSLLPNCNRCQ